MTQIAISILNFNSSWSTITCVQSLMNATRVLGEEHSVEIYIADNSSDESEARKLESAFSEFPDTHLMVNAENLGFAAGHNRNLKFIFSNSNPDYVWLLNNDCEVDERALVEMLDSAKKNPQVGVWGATLLEDDGKTIQCAGGCFYNSWLSTFRRYGRGKSVSRRDRLWDRKLDYIAGASLFFPAATLLSGLEPIPTLPDELASGEQQWLNENFFLYFEELDLAKRLKPGSEMAWCRNALIKHEGGTSAGTRHNKRSATAEYHSTVSALKYTVLYYPKRLWFVAAARYLLKSLLLIFILNIKLLKPLTLGYRDFRRWLKFGVGSRKQPRSDQPLITVVVPSMNQGRFLDDTLSSIFAQELPVEVYVMDGGSTDNSLEVIHKWESQLAGWRSHPDEGQAAAINEGVKLGSAPYVCWLNSDDFYYPNGLKKLLIALQNSPQCKYTYGRCWTVSESGKKISPYITVNFSPRLFANFCFIAQPASLVTRTAWSQVGGLNESMNLAFDYDLWWRLYGKYGEPKYCRNFVASTRMHKATKTANLTEQHYRESIEVVKRNWGSVPLKWRAGLPFMKLIRKFG